MINFAPIKMHSPARQCSFVIGLKFGKPVALQFLLKSLSAEQCKQSWLLMYVQHFSDVMSYAYKLVFVSKIGFVSKF
jgi:hypothetical protein